MPIAFITRSGLMRVEKKPDDARLSRSGRTNPFGKCTVQLSLKVSESEAEEYQSNATKVGISQGEYDRICMALLHNKREQLEASYSQLLDAIEELVGKKYLSQRHHRPLAVTKKATKVLHLRRAA